MTLDMLKKGQIATIKKINADMVLKDRLLSFGIMQDESIELKTHSLAKNTFEVQVGSTLVALREEEAKKIEVKITNNF
ncbi:MAG: FeoA family protein [Sulfurovaceae bacterium]|nr:FeoA family protein [Sulfurovaceae bacterium]MDD5549311.1 FeoA family protein [Sulfurovaceae bacterium]